MNSRGFLIVAIGLAALTRPDIVRRTWNRANDQRRDQLKAGAEEVYFEERRQLQAYRIRRLWTVRLIGAIAVALGILALVM